MDPLISMANAFGAVPPQTEEPIDREKEIPLVSLESIESLLRELRLQEEGNALAAPHTLVTFTKRLREVVMAVDTAYRETIAGQQEWQTSQFKQGLIPQEYYQNEVRNAIAAAHQLSLSTVYTRHWNEAVVELTSLGNAINQANKEVAEESRGVDGEASGGYVKQEGCPEEEDFNRSVLLIA